mmetsp:Transcript_27545/g.89709  ORF Transcript_27545/g.89709 Transcript_27545/m.89709 type:complete len:1062 (-) Transcript_27545:78-3263(-)
MNTDDGSSARLESFYEVENFSEAISDRQNGAHSTGMDGHASDAHKFDAGPAVDAAEKQKQKVDPNPQYWRRHVGHTDGTLDMLFAPNMTRMYVSGSEHEETPQEEVSETKRKTISAFQKVKLITAWAKKGKFLNGSNGWHSPLKSPNRGSKVASTPVEPEADAEQEVQEIAEDGKALDRLRIASKKIGIAKKAFGKRPELKQASFAKKFPINKALQRAAHRVTIVKAFEHNNLFSRLAAEAKGYMNSGSPTLTALKAILSSDRTNAEIIELTFDYPSLKAEVKAILKKEQKDRERRLTEERVKLALGGTRRPSRRPTLHKSASLMSDPLSKWSPVEIDEDERRRVLGYGQSKEEFLESLGGKADVTANQVVVARLMQALSDLNNSQESDTSRLHLLNFYKCFHPDSKFVDIWTIVYVMLILYIATIGIYRTTFVEIPSSNCNPAFSEWDWFDFSVDGFFLIDVLLRTFLFGQFGNNNASTWENSEAVLEPSKVIVMYMKNGMLVDTITSVPIQWIVMFGVPSCNTSNSSQLLYLRLLRLYRLTRIYKLFQSYKIKSWLRYLKRRIGNNNILQMVNLAIVVMSINHIWTCLSWLVQSTDSTIDPASGLSGFEQYQTAIGLQLTASPFQQYSVSFMVTLQIMFAIDPYNATTTPEAWFGVLTVCLSVVINATMLSKVIEIWETINRAQTERDNRINAVMEFLRSNGIDGMLRNDILDYFEFRYSNEHFDVEKKLLDELPTEMQSRVIHKIFPRALDSCYLFTGASEGFIAQCVVRMARRPLRTMPGQVITAEGTLGSEMFLLKSGSAEVSVQDVGGKPRGLGLIGPGQCFGEISLWMESRRTATVTSLDYCQLFMLAKEDLENVLDRFPEMAPSIATFAIAPILRTKELVPSMEGLTQYAAERIARRMAFNREDFADGEELCSYGKPAATAYVIRTGKIFSEVYQGRLEILHNDLRCVGFTEMLVGKTYQETVKAKGMVQAYKLTYSDMLELLGSSSESYVLEQIKISAQKQFRKVKKAHIGMRWNLLLDSILSIIEVPDQTENGNMLQIMMGAIGQRSPRPR